MRAYIVEITAKVIHRSDTDPEELPADIYSRLSEQVLDEDIIDLGVEVFTLPSDLSGSPDRGDEADPEEGSEAPVP